jgi:hypothetical protein
VTPPDKKAGRKSVAKKSVAKKPSRRTLGGPELKIPSFKKPSMRMPSGPSIKAPTPIAGAIGNLREGRTLPVILVLVCAIVAVPFLLGKSEDAPPVHAPSLAAGTVGAAGAPTAVVTASNQAGVREYKKRLSGDAQDPFVPRYSTEPPSAGQVPETGAATGASAVTSPAGGTSPSTKPGTGADSGQAWLTHTVDLYAGPSDAEKLPLREGVQTGTVLPNRKHKIAAFTGVPDGSPNVAWFVLSRDVTIVRNDGKCNLDSCGIVGLNPGEVLKLKDLSGQVWMIKLQAIQRVIVTDPK